MSSNSADITGTSGGRKLIAVLYADMVGYSRLIGLDDAGTLRRLKALRANLIDPSIAEYGGKIVQTGGDSLLIAFDSIDGAVRCAVKLQQQVPVQDRDQPRDRAIRFRIGINLGDTIADGTDLHGDAVNVASRLQAECPPGRICVSRSVRDHVHGRLGLEFDELGSLTLKNIARPVEAFVLKLDAAATMMKRGEALLQGNASAPQVPDKPSIAVLPFTNMSNEQEQEYFSDGIANDIIAALSRVRWLFVIARNSSFTYKGRAVDVRKVARELGVRYVVEGSVRRSISRVRVTAELIDAEVGNHIWAERYDRDISEIFAVQDDITEAVVSAIVPAVSDTEQQRALRKMPESLDAWALYQRGLWHMAKCNIADNVAAQEFFTRAIDLEPSFSPAYSAAAIALNLDGAAYGSRPVDEAMRLAGERAREAVALNPTDIDAQAALALLRFTVDGNDAGLTTLTTMLRHNPNAAWAHGIKGVILVQLGRTSEGRVDLVTAERLNPRDPSAAFFPTHLAIADYYDRDYVQAITTAKNVIERYPQYPLAYRWLAATFGQLGKAEDARRALDIAMQVRPEAFNQYVHRCPPWFLPANHEHMLEGLRKAGWQG
jgi:adenylate cyclase